MIEETLDIPTKDGAMETFTCRPERGGPYPAILFFMDAPGIREELHEMARRLATVGYFVLQPNLYYRAGRDMKNFGPDLLEKGSAAQTRMRSVRTKMTIPPVKDDIAAMLDYVDAHNDAKPGPVGTHGYCMSDPYSLAAAARFPDRVAAAASFYGTCWSAMLKKARTSISARRRASCISVVRSMTIWRRRTWSRN
jgi:carboxymethylenebutenolidase